MSIIYLDRLSVGEGIFESLRLLNCGMISEMQLARSKMTYLMCDVSVVFFFSLE